MSPGSGGSVLVTGCSSGIGRACVALLAGAGYRVFAGVRRDLDARELERTAGASVTPVILDVTADESVDRAAKTISASVGQAGLDALVNNAGVVVSGPLEYLPAAELERQFDVNVFGTLRVTRACLPLLRAAQGRVVIVGSIAGRVSFPFLGPYAASKAALASIGATLRMELRGAGVQACVVEPGAVATPLWGKSTESARHRMAVLSQEAIGAYGEDIAAVLSSGAAAASIGAPPEAVARAIARALSARRMKGRYLVGWDARFLELSRVLLPPAVHERLQIALAYWGRRSRRAPGVAET